MRKIAVTGMTASQRSKKYNESSVCFAGALSDALVLSTGDVTVEWLDNTVDISEEQICEYDAVLVGISPVSSLAANHAYSALRAADVANTVGNLVIFVDAPEPEKIFHSLSAIQRRNDLLYKELYSRRPGYAKAKGDKKTAESINNSVDFLLSEKDTTVLYPSLPFSDVSSSVAAAVVANRENAIGLNFDKMYIQHGSAQEAASGAMSGWLVDGATTAWFKKLHKSLQAPYAPMRQRRMEHDASVSARLRESLGAIIAPQHDGNCWWTHRYIQSLCETVPVVSEWRSTASLGSSWSTLAISIEEMSRSERIMLAISQMETYVSCLKDVDAQITTLLQRIGVTHGNTV